jgi:hypothetical protein
VGAGAHNQDLIALRARSAVLLKRLVGEDRPALEAVEPAAPMDHWHGNLVRAFSDVEGLPYLIVGGMGLHQLQVLGPELVACQPTLHHRFLQHAAVVAGVVVQTGCRRADVAAFQAGRRRSGQHVLGNAHGRAAERPDGPGAPLLLGQPLDGIIAVLQLAPGVGEEGGVLTLGLEPPAQVLDRVHIALPEDVGRLLRKAVFAVRRPRQDDGPRPLFLRVLVDVSREADAVPHRDHDRFRLDGGPLGETAGGGDQGDQEQQGEALAHGSSHLELWGQRTDCASTITDEQARRKVLGNAIPARTA